MKTTKEKFLEVVSKEENTSLERTRERVKNRDVIREAQSIAMKVLDRLEELRWSQKRLAEELHVSPQQVNKIVKGSENLTLETLVRLQKVLKISLLVSDLERQSDQNDIPATVFIYEGKMIHSFTKVKKLSKFSTCDFSPTSEYSNAITLKACDHLEMKLINRVPIMISDSPVILGGKAHHLSDYLKGEKELY